MAKESQQERQLRIARECLARALAAGDAGEAAQHLVQLPPGAERDTNLPLVGRLLRSELARAFATQKWDRVGFFAARVAKEPRLLTEGAESAEVHAAAWVLLWSAVKSKVWPRAEAHLLTLRPVLSPRLIEALELVIAHQGSPPAELQRALPEPPAADPRLGYDVRRTAPMVEVAAPRTVVEVEGCLLALFAARDWASFSEAASRWAEAAPGEVGRAIHALAAALSLREVLQREGENVFAPARFLARQALAAGTPPELRAEVGLAFRRVVAELPPEIHSRHAFDALDAAARAALAYVELRPLVAGAVPGLIFGVELQGEVLSLLGVLYGAVPSATVVWKALRVAAVTDPPMVPPPKWLVAAVESQLALGGVLSATLQSLPDQARAIGPIAAARVLPVPLAEKIIDSLWAGASAELQHVLSLAVGQLMDRETEEVVPSGGGRGIFDDMVMRMAKQQGMKLNERELKRFYDDTAPELMGGLDEVLDSMDDGPAELTPAGKALFQRQAARLIPQGIGFLETALELAATPQERAQAVQRFWEGNPEPRARLRAISDAFEDDSTAVLEALRARFLPEYSGQGPVLTRALASAWSSGMERRWVGDLCAAVLHAAEQPSWRQTPEEANLVLRARLHLSSTRRPPRDQWGRLPRRPPKQRTLPLPPPERKKGAPFELEGCLLRFGYYLSQKYAPGTVSAYTLQSRKFFAWLQKEGKLGSLCTGEQLADLGNDYLDAVRETKGGSVRVSALKALLRFDAAHHELES